MIKRNLTLFKIDNFLNGLWPLSAVAIIYFENIAHSYTSAMLVFSIINFSQSIFEIPTGIMSDKIGRRKSMVIGTLLILIGYIMWAVAGFCQNVVLLYIGAMFVGIGQSFLSGTDDALAFETISQLRKKDEFDKVFADNRSYDELGIAVGATAATIIYFFYPIDVLAYLAVLPAFLRFIVSCFYIEPQYINRSKNSFLSHFFTAFQKIVKNPKLLKFSLVKSLNDSLNAVNWRFIGAYYQTVIAPWLINVVRIFQEIMGYFSYRLVKRVRHYNAKNTLFISIFINAFIKMFGAVINIFISPFIMASSTILYGISTTFENNLLQQQLTDNERATMGSVIALWTAFLNVLIFLAIGFVADIFDVRISVFVIMLARMFVAILYRIILK